MPLPKASRRKRQLLTFGIDNVETYKHAARRSQQKEEEEEEEGVMVFSPSSSSPSSSYSHCSSSSEGEENSAATIIASKVGRVPSHHRRSRRRTSSALPIERSMQVCSDAESVRRVKQSARYHTVLTRNAQFITASDLMISDDVIPLTRICDQFIYDYVVCVKMKNPSHAMASMIECGRKQSCEAMRLYLSEYDGHEDTKEDDDDDDDDDDNQQQMDDHPYQSIHGAMGTCKSCTETRRFFIRYNVLNWAESIKSQFHAAETTRQRSSSGSNHVNPYSRSALPPLLPPRIAVAATQPVGMFFRPDTKPSSNGHVIHRQSNASFPQSYPTQDHAFNDGLYYRGKGGGEEESGIEDTTSYSSLPSPSPSPLLLHMIPSADELLSSPPPPPPLYLVGIIDDFEMRIDGANSRVMHSAHAPRIRKSQLSFDGCTIPIRVVIKSMQLLKATSSSSSAVVSSSLESSPTLQQQQQQQQQQRKGSAIASLSRGNLRRLDRAACSAAVRDSIHMTLRNVIMQSMVISDQENELNLVHGARACYVTRSRITPPFPGVCDFGDMEITIV